ncbi:Rpn family recombination-promoting nuclease/putative transposase [Halarsenatibacter silvermanii]|uniref:Rpn family recombination-promoting nuclease/putative transposase n=1 Tax=Halarsenatibacter silvermanii TaxID=321763 RepID=UPI0013563320|nr:Rpn family recombination-promoting nuclease/putative transposase [Halarsenatibacter silvermanii]
MLKFLDRYDIINKPHDGLFIRALGDAEAAREFIELRLPDKFQERMKLDTIKSEDTSYVDERFDRFSSDRVFSVELEGGQKAYVAYLFEHKSKMERDTIYQLLKYYMAIWDDKMNEDGDIPLIIPILFYHGREDWTAPTKLSELIMGETDWAEEIIPEFECYLYTLEDLVEVMPGMTVPKLRFYIEVLSIVREKGEIFLELFDEFLKNVSEYVERSGEDDFYYSVYLYVLQDKDAEEEIDSAKVIDIARKYEPEGRDRVKTLADELKEEAKQEGFEEGKEKGRREELIDTLVTFLEGRFGVLSEDLEEKIEASSMEDLKKLRENFFNIDSLEEAEEILSE